MPTRRPNVTQSKKHTAKHLLFFLAVLIFSGAACSYFFEDKEAKSSGLAISWVSSDRQGFAPQKDENVTLRFRVSSPSHLTVRFMDPFDLPIRTIHHEAEEPGEQRIVWDGRDDEGRLVPPEAYAYTISASTGEGRNSSPPVVYDLREKTGGEWVRGVKVNLDTESGKLTYTIPRAGRVRIILSQQGSGWPFGTLVDWVPRAAGSHEEKWDVWDSHEVVRAGEISKLVPLIFAFALPDNSVVVTGPTPENDNDAVVGHPVDHSGIPHRVAATDSSEATKFHHARHPRARCFDPEIKLSFPEAPAKTGEKMLRLTKSLALRVEVAPEQPPGRMKPIPRGVVFILIDGAVVERNLDGYLPYQWVVDPSSLTPGEHLITASVGWREDHFGTAHIKVLVEK